MAMGGEVVPSAPKHAQWKTYEQVRSRLLGRELPTRKRLKLLHFIFTSNADLGLLVEERTGIERQMRFIDHPQAKELQDTFVDRMGELEKEAQEKKLSPPEILERGEQICEALYGAGTKVRFAPGIRGRLRYYGQRKVDGEDWKTLYASHTCLFDNSGGLMSALTGYPPPAYYGLSTGLPTVYRRLCDRYDELRKSAKTLDEQLLAEAYLQLIGTRVLHPFWDANGRTFAAHIDQTIGNGTLDHRAVQRVTAALTDVNDRFLRTAILPAAGLGLIQGNDHFLLRLSNLHRVEYMAKLRTTIENAITQALDPNGPYYEYYKEAAWNMKIELIRCGKLKLDDEEMQQVRREVRAKAKDYDKIPESAREYLLEKYVDYYLANHDPATVVTHSIFDHNIKQLIRKGVSKRVFEQLVRLMKRYEAYGIDIGMACEFASHADRLKDFLEKDSRVERRCERICDALCEQRTVDAFASWDPYPRTFFAKRAWYVLELQRTQEQTERFGWLSALWNGKRPDDTIRRITQVMESQEVKKLYAQYQHDGNVNFRVVNAVADVAGHTADTELAVEMCKLLQSQKFASGIESTLGAIAEAAEYLKDGESIRNVLAILGSKAEAKIISFVHGLSSAIYHGKRVANQHRAKAKLRKSLDRLRN